MRLVRNAAFISLAAFALAGCAERRGASQPPTDGASAAGDAAGVAAMPEAGPVRALSTAPVAAGPVVKADAQGPLRKRALLGPRPTIEALCKDVLLDGLTPAQAADASCGVLGVTEAAGTKDVSVLAAPIGPIRAARILERRDADGSYCALAIETSTGWFVDASHDLGTVMCSNVGTERVEVRVKELSARAGVAGSAVLVLGFTQNSAHQGDDSDLATTTSVFCRVEGAGTPVCGEVRTAQSKRALSSTKLQYEWSLAPTWRPDGALEIRQGASKGKVPEEERTYIQSALGVHRL